MKDYVSEENTVFTDKILLLEESDDNYAENFNVPYKQIFGNTVKNHEDIKCLDTNTRELAKAGFTFIIDSVEKVIDWLHRREENDYSRVLIKQKEDESAYDIKIDMENREFNWFPLAADYVEFEDGASLEFASLSGVTNNKDKISVVLKCINSRNVKISSDFPAEYIISGGSHINAAVMGGHCGGFNGCDGLYGCVVDGCDMSWTGTYPFYDCRKLYHCTADGILLTEKVFYNCTDLVGCQVGGDNYTNGTFYYPYRECRCLYGCTAVAIPARGPGAGSGRMYSQLFSGCRKLYDCRPVYTEEETFDGMVRSDCTEDHDLWDAENECFWQIKVNGGQLQLEKVYDDE